MNLNTDERPWGTERCLTQNEVSTVKLLYVKAGESLSLQLHHKREEFWKIISGNPLVEIGDEKHGAKADEEFTIKVSETHRLSAPSDDAVVLEISTGSFDENDEVRLEDKYNRS